MKCSVLKRMLMICMVSAVVVSGTATGVLAVDESVVDGSAVVSSDGGVQEESDVTGDVEEDGTVEDVTVGDGAEEDVAVEDGTGEDVTVEDGTGEDGVQEFEEDNLDDIEVSDFSDVSEASDYVEVSDASDYVPDGIPSGDIGVQISLGGNFAKAHGSYEKGYLDFSKVRVSILTADKGTVLDSFMVTNDMYESEVSSMVLGVRDVYIENWSKGAYFYVRFENLPSVYSESTQDIKVEYREEAVPDENNIATDVMMPLYFYTVAPQLREFNSLFFVYDSSGNSAVDAELEVRGLNDDNKVVYKKSLRTSKEGVAWDNIKVEGIDTLQISLLSTVSNEIVGSDLEYHFERLASNSDPGKYIIQTEMSLSEVLDSAKDKDDGLKVTTVNFSLGYKDKWDMLLFKKRTVGISLYSGRDLVHTMALGGTNVSGSIALIEGRYTIQSTEGMDYAVDVGDGTLIVHGDTMDRRITAIPQLSLKVINEKGGKHSNAHFEVVGYSGEFNETSHAFAVNNGGFYSVRNLDTDEVYDVYIGGYRETVLNIADGSVVSSGALDGGTSTSTSASNTDDNVLPPQTGDIFGGVLLSMVGVTGLFGAGYLYYRRKGRKADEKK